MLDVPTLSAKFFRYTTTVFIILTLFTSRISEVQASQDWLQCYLIDFEGYEDTVYMLDQGNLYLYYYHPNKAPLSYDITIDGESVYTHSAFLPQLVDGLPITEVQQDFEISPEMQDSLGVGNHTLILTISSTGTTSHQCNRTFALIEEVFGVYALTSNWYAATNQEFEVMVHVDSGVPFVIEWKVINDEGDVVLMRETEKRKKTDQGLEETKMVLSDAGVYTIQVTVYNELSLDTASTDITILQPITAVSVTTDSPRQYPDTTVNFNLLFGDVPPPSSVHYDVSYGDGSFEYDVPVGEDGSDVSLQHSYHSSGLYTVQISVYNRVSLKTVTANVGILQDIEDVSLVPYTKHNGYVNPQHILPMEYTVKLFANVSLGTVEYCRWKLGSKEINTTSVRLWYKFPKAALYNVSVTVMNTFSESSAISSLTILESVTSLYLVNNGPVQLDNNITYVLFCKQRGSNPFYRVDFGDGMEMDLPIPKQNPHVEDFLPKSLKIPFDPLKYYSTVFKHLYQTDGRFVAVATGSNLVSHVISSSEAFIQLRPCQIPDIHIRDGGSNYDLATKYKRNKSFLFAGNVDLDCQGAARADYQWRVYVIDDIFSVPSATNELHLPDNVNSKVTDLYVPKYSLNYGGYIFELTVMMVMKDGTIGVSNKDQSYIEVVQSPLVAKISGGSAIEVGWSSNITLDGSESLDPDWTDPFNGLFHWYCHLSNETFSHDVDLNKELPTEGGCLGSGFKLQSGNSSTLDIEAKTLPGNQTYTFHLAINKTGRTGVGWAKQIVRVMPGHPPALSIKCLQNCDTHVNPSHRLALLGTCTDCELHTKNKFTWTIGSDDSLPDQLEGFRHVSYGQRKAYLSLPVNMFQGSETYTIRLHIQSWSGASSTAEYAMTTNSAPSLGTCTVSPSEGIVLETKFSIECKDFTDPEGPLMYEAHSYTGAESAAVGNSLTDQGTLIYYGVDPIFPPTLLPIGVPSNDYKVSIQVKVLDTLGASIETTTIVKVIEPQIEDQKELVEDTVLRLAQGEDSALHQLVQSGSSQSATQLINTVTSMLNAEATKRPDGADLYQQNVKMEKRIQARESLIDNLIQVEVRDMESLEQTSAAMAQVTQQQQEVSLQAQVQMTDVYLGMGHFLKDQSNSGVGGQVVESSARFLVSGLSNMMGAAHNEIEQINIKIGNETTDNLGNSTTDEEGTELQNRTMKARNVTLSALATLQDVKAAILHNKVPGEEPAELTTDSLSVLLGRQENWQLDGLALESRDGAFTFHLPDRMHSIIEEQQGMESDDDDDIIDTQMYHFKNNPFSWTPDSNQVTSQVTSLQFSRTDQSEVAITNIPDDINIILANDYTTKLSPLLASIDPVTNQTLYAFNWTNSNSSVLIQVEPDFDGFNSEHVSRIQPELKVCIQFESPPNATHNDGCIMLPQDKAKQNGKLNFTGSSSSNVSPYSWLLQPVNLVDVGMYYITIDMVQNLEACHNHTVYAYSTQCVYWDGEEEAWKGDGCKVGPYTSLTHTHCQCNHLTSFALSFFVLPNALNIARDIQQFLQFVENPITVVAIIVVFTLYAVSAIWARWKDKMEDQQAKVIFLEDNDPTAHYRYHITVFTGLRKNSGTSAVVTLTLYGTFGTSHPHILSAKKQVVLQRNNMDSFLITTHQSLGHLTSVRVWHDNSGKSPEWYVSRILVHDLESDLWWYFLCRSWLAVDLGDSRIDKTFPVATEEDLNEFRNLVLSKSMRDLKDNHLWFSVFVKPPQSYFTRLQRASCCLSLLLTSAMLNIMFYGTPENPELQNLELGTVQISTTSILIGVEASLISVPISIAIVTIFRNARPRHVTVPDPLLAHTDSSLSLVASGMTRSLHRLRHYLSHKFTFSKHKSSQDSLLSELSELEGKNSISSSTTSSWSGISSSITTSWSASQIPSLASSGASYSKLCGKGDVLPSASVKAVSKIEVEGKLMSSYDIGCDDNGIVSSSVVHVSGVNENRWSTSSASSAENHQNNIFVAMDIGEPAKANKLRMAQGGVGDNGSQRLMEMSKKGPEGGVNGEIKQARAQDEVLLKQQDLCTPSTYNAICTDKSQLIDTKCLVSDLLDNSTKHTDLSNHDSIDSKTTGNQNQALASSSNVQDKDTQNQDNKETLLSSSWEFSDDFITYKTHQDFLCDKLNECREFIYNAPSNEFTTSKDQQKAYKKLNLILTMHGWEETSHEGDQEKHDDLSEQGCMPWWCIYIAWGIVLSSSLVCAFVIMLYGLRYGKQTSMNWLVAMTVSVIQSVLIVQPIKVVVMAAVFAIALRTHEVDDVGAQFFRNWKPPKFTASLEDAEETLDSCQRFKLLRAKNALYYNPPATSTVVKAREKRRIAAKVHSMMRALLGQIVFVFFVLEIAYAQQNRDSFYLGKALRDKYSDGLEEVSTLSDFYGWMSDQFIPNVYGEEDPAELQDSNVLIGGVRLRQVRVKPGACKVPSTFQTLIPSCKSPLTIGSLDKESYGPSWAYVSSEKDSKGLWAYQGGAAVQGSYYHIALAGYDNGGYVANLGTRSVKALKVVTQLKEESWGNDHTWALFVEWTVYNGNTNLFSVNTILFEVDTIGNLRGSAEYAIMRIHRYISQYDIFIRSLEGIYIAVILVMMYRDYNKWKTLGKEYFDFWNGLNLIIIAISICAIALYSLRHIIGMEAMDQHKQDPRKFVSFARVAFINQLLIQLIALIVFFGTVKCAKVLRYNSSIFMLQKALQNVSKQFLSFTFGIAIAITSFASYAFLEFSTSLINFKTFLTSCQTLFVAITGGFEHMEGVVDAYPLQAFFFFTSLSFFGIFIIFNIYISFILSSFSEAKQQPDNFADHDVVAALVSWILDRFAIDRHPDSTSDIQLKI